MSGKDTSPQLGFEVLLKDAEAENRAREFERETGHLPGTMDDALPFYRALLAQHHEAMLAADIDGAMRLRDQVHKLALRLNGGDPGILAGPGAPGCVLERKTEAAPGTVPLWGQTGSFAIAVEGMQVRIELDGIFGVTGSVCFWPGFSTHAVDFDKPFLSETGYRSFLGLYADPVPGMLPDEFTRKVVESYLAGELKSHLVAIEDRYRRKASG